MSTIAVQDVGPIGDSIGFNPSTEGGVWIVKGPNGGGKTTLINTVRSAMSDTKAKLHPRDGAKHGKAEVAGAVLHIGGRVQRSGELALLGIDGRLNLSRFVDPGLKDETAADRARIEELATLTGVKPDVALFYELVGGQKELEAVLNADAIAKAIKSGDVVELADQIAKDLHKAGRDAESQSKIEHGHAEAQKAAIEGVDLKVELDDAVLQRAYVAALNDLSKLKQEEATAEQAVGKGDAARKKMDMAKLQYDGPTVEDADGAVTACGKTLDEARTSVSSLNEQIAKLQKQRDDLDKEATLAKHHYDSAVARRASAVQHVAMLGAWAETIRQATDFKGPTAEELEAADVAVQKAKDAITLGVKARGAIAAQDKAKTHAAASSKHEATAIRYRDAARGTDEILSKLVAGHCDVLRVVEGRLQAQHGKRGWINYHEFSPGERWKVALQIAIKRIRDSEKEGQALPALIPLPQSSWESLQPAVREEIWEMAKAERVCILAEQPDDQPIRIVEFVPETAA
jgi:chorismate mutase